MKINGKYACVPNWFYKEHFEDALDRELTKHQFVILAEYIQEDLMDSVSNLVMDYLESNKKDIQQLLDSEEED